MATEKQIQYISDLCEELNHERDFDAYFAMKVKVVGGESRITYMDSYKKDAKKAYPQFKKTEEENNKCLVLIKSWAENNSFSVEDASETIGILKSLKRNPASKIYHKIRTGCTSDDIEDGIYNPSSFYKTFGKQLAAIHHKMK
jgi:hypothetical protein